MKPQCPKCLKNNLDEGLNGRILCHDCKKFFVLVEAWVLGR